MAATNATVVSHWKDANNAYLTVMVAEGGAAGTVEYTGAVDLPTYQALPDAASKKEALRLAVKAVRDAQVGASKAVLGVISGTVVV